MANTSLIRSENASPSVMLHALLCFILPQIVFAIIENSGFHCKIGSSLRLDKRFHGKPQETSPPFELSVLDEKGRTINVYVPGETYKLRIVGFIHFRGFLVQPRIATSDGHILGSLRAGRFLEESNWPELGIRYQTCGILTNDSLTHSNDNKKFLLEALWKIDFDVGGVQFIATILSDDGLYWERWRPANGFIRPKRLSNVTLNLSLFPNEENKNSSGSGEDISGLPFNVEDISVFESTFPTVELEPISKGAIPAPSDVRENHQREFKRFLPQDGLTDADLKFLNSHTALTHKDDVIELTPLEACHQEQWCENGGKCRSVENNVECECAPGYVGKNCSETNFCLDHACSPNSSCINHLKGYTCKCERGFVGTFCQLECPKDQCLNGGECMLRTNGQIGCRCSPGWTGSKCHKEVNECNYGKCKNGATCQDLVNDYKCNCTAGWMGKDCDRPCRDVYGSCRVWKREGECVVRRSSTDFFDQNCAASCGLCQTVSDIQPSNSFPLAPILLPLAWLLGEWRSQVRGYRDKTIDYPMDMNDSMAYTETLIFSVAEPTMFGTPSINYTCISESDRDPHNVHRTNGFLTIRQYPPAGDKSLKASLISVNNHGLTLIEEGDILLSLSPKVNQLLLSPIYVKAFDENMKPEKLSRSWTRKGNRLQQFFSKEHKGRNIKYSKTYVRTKTFDYL